MTRRRLIAIALVVAAGWVGHQQVQAATGYVQVFSEWLMSETEPLSGKTVKFVNGNGAVAGTESAGGSQAARSFVWTLTDGYVDPGTLGGSSATLVGLNDQRMAAGNSSITDGGPTRAFVWTKKAGMVDLGTLGGSFAEAADINNRGWIVGRSATATRIRFEEEGAFVWTPDGGMARLEMPGCLHSTDLEHRNGATRVSDSGIVVGYVASRILNSSRPGRVHHAAVWDLTAQTCTELFSSPDDALSFSYSIADLVTNSGWVAGRISIGRIGDDADPSFRTIFGFVWSAATGVRLIFGGRITDLNEDGWATVIFEDRHDQLGGGLVLRPGQPDLIVGSVRTDVPFFVLDNHIVVGHSESEDEFRGPRAFYWHPDTGRHELDAPTSTDYSIAFNHSGDRFVGITQSLGERGSHTLRPFVWDGALQNLTRDGSQVGPQVSMQIGSTGFIAWALNTSLSQITNVWAPPLPSFGFTGFKRPVEGTLPVIGTGQFNDAKAGSTIKVRFNLNDTLGPEVLKWGYPRVLPADCTTGAGPVPNPTEGPHNNLPQGPPMLFQDGPDRYTFTWATDAALVNTCKRLEFHFIDGSVEAALFKFR